jgi:hypothetical protein
MRQASTEGYQDSKPISASTTSWLHGVTSTRCSPAATRSSRNRDSRPTTKNLIPLRSQSAPANHPSCCWWLSAPYWKKIVVLCSTTTPREYLNYLERCGIERIVAGEDHVDLGSALEELHVRYGVKTVRIDSGGTLNGVMLRAGLVDEVSVLVHPALVGGPIPRTIFRLPEGLPNEDPIALTLMRAETLRDGIVWLRYQVAR